VVRSALLVVALVATVGTAARSHLWTSSPAAERVESSGDLLVLGPADTLWSIAGEHYPESRRVEAIAALEELNGPSGSLLPGDVLALPELR
jgi:Tfp pilus assembly protein FimV